MKAEPEYLPDRPQLAGYFMRRNLPQALWKNDFQDYPLWRDITYSMLSSISKEYKGYILVPMTIVNPSYFEETVGRLREDGIPVQHYTICASRNVLLKRLKSRREGSSSWAAQQIDRCLEGLSSDVFQRHLDTDQMSTYEVVERIADLSEIQLMPDNRGRLRKSCDRMVNQFKHIRFFQ